MLSLSECVEEEEKRMYEGAQPEGYFTAVGYKYDNAPTPAKELEDTPTPPPAPPMSSVLVDKGVDGDKFVPPEGLPLPSNLTLVCVCARARVCVCMCMHACVCAYIHKQYVPVVKLDRYCGLLYIRMYIRM